MNQIVNGMYRLLEYPFSLTEMGWQQTESLDTNVNSAPVNLTGMGLSQLILGTAAFIFSAYATTKVVLPCLQRVASSWVNREEVATINQEDVEYRGGASNLENARSICKQVEEEFQINNPEAYQAWHKLRAFLHTNPEIDEKSKEGIPSAQYDYLAEIAKSDVWVNDPVGHEKINNFLQTYEQILFNPEAFAVSLDNLSNTDKYAFVENFVTAYREIDHIIDTMRDKYPNALSNIQTYDMTVAIMKASETVLADKPKDLAFIRDNLKVFEGDPNAMQSFTVCMGAWLRVLNELDGFMLCHADPFYRCLGEFRIQHTEHEQESVEYLESFIDFLVSSCPFQPLEQI